MDRLIKPHGSDSLNPLFVADDAKRAALEKEAEGLPKLLVCSQAAANAVMMASGYFNPLTGFMNLADSLAVAEGMKTTGGLFWPVPIVTWSKTPRRSRTPSGLRFWIPTSTEVPSWRSRT